MNPEPEERGLFDEDERILALRRWQEDWEDQDLRDEIDRKIIAPFELLIEEIADLKAQLKDFEPEVATKSEIIAIYEKRIADMKAQLATAVDCNRRLDEKSAGIAELERIMKIDEMRLIDAANKAEIEYMGCDTPDAMVDIIIDLRQQIEAWKDKAVEERAIAIYLGENFDSLSQEKKDIWKQEASRELEEEMAGCKK